ncbi:hypothetical protein BVRB_9g224640 [Beta vulgaris subsp. vulgaris]|uniref:CCHC-type domain-containing protein n=1 Tax=Beta vulgaris subsp. vulgaris TaxID=3555 RepID=A0A0J8B643_BETVV|nr:hypothetical protein BVRB_9g224640 [Beta vulgaris subsp. vulgaris]
MDDIGWDKSARLRILLDVTKPLKRVQRIAVKSGGSVLVELKYERLPTFCYMCGVIGHIERDCLSTVFEDKDVEKQWGSWIRASPRKGRQKLEEEAKEFLKGARQITFENVSQELQVQQLSPNSSSMDAARRTCRDGDVVKARADHAGGDGGQAENPCMRVASVPGDFGVAGQEVKEKEKPLIVEGGLHENVASSIVVMQQQSQRGKAPISLEDGTLPYAHNETNVTGDSFISSLTFVAGNGEIAKKFKKHKSQSRVLKNIDVSLTENPCIIADGLMAGDKRKLVDNMMVDGGVESVGFGSKKKKRPKYLMHRNFLFTSGNLVMCKTFLSKFWRGYLPSLYFSAFIFA